MLVVLIGAGLTTVVSFAVGWLFAHGEDVDVRTEPSADSASPVEFGVGMVDLA